jgi:hypothetical protein
MKCLHAQGAGGSSGEAAGCRRQRCRTGHLLRRPEVISYTNGQSLGDLLICGVYTPPGKGDPRFAAIFVLKHMFTN